MTLSRRNRPGEARPALDARRAQTVALDLLSRKPWTRHDLVARLRRRGAPPDIADAVVADLEARGYVDDRAFAVVWAESRARSRSFGRQRLQGELRARGVAPPFVEAALAYAFEETSELARAQAVGEHRLAMLRRRDPDQAPRRLHDYLRRRGYPADVIRQVLRTLCRDGAAEELKDP